CAESALTNICESRIAVAHHGGAPLRWLPHTLLGVSLAIAATSASAASPSAGLTPGEYTAGPAGATASATNREARLTVQRFRVTANLGEQHAPAHQAFLTVSTEWTNVGSIQYLVPQLNNHLFLLIDGDHQAILSDAMGAAPHPLTMNQLLVP